MDLWCALRAQETAKRAIEIALVGGHSLVFSAQANEGYYFGFTSYDMGRLTGPSRDLAEAHIARHGGDGMTLSAAQEQVTEIETAIAFLAKEAGVPVSTLNPALFITVMPLTMADFLLPPPNEHIDPVVARIKKARDALEHVSYGLDPNAERLLDYWKTAVGADDNLTAQMHYIGHTIAALNGRKYVDRISLAEAFAYAPRQP